jgi:hypothetical protein
MSASTSKQETTIKSEERKKRTVFKQLLDTPFNLTWYLSLLYSIAPTDVRKFLDQDTSNDVLNVLCRYSDALP